MSAPIFLLQIVDNTSQHVLARIPGGGPLELDFIEACVVAIMAKRPEYSEPEEARAKIRVGITNALMSLKSQTRYLAV